MAIVTAGYDGTVDEVQFAEVLYRYSVIGPDDFKATTQAGDRIVSIADGVALGPGTRDVATAIPNIQFAAAATGATRWDLVVLRRDWQPPGGATTVTIIQGGSTKGYPVVGTAATDWNRRPGIMDDQPLYLQEVVGTSLGTRVDLRVWAGHGGLTAVSEDVKTYLQRVGAEVLINGIQWVYALGANNVPGWISTATAEATTDIVTFGAGWSGLTGGHKPRLYTSGRMVHLVGAVNIGTNGVITNMLTIPAAFRPVDPSSTFVGSNVSSGGASYELLLSNGVLSIPTSYLQGTITANHVLPVTASWPRY